MRLSKFLLAIEVDETVKYLKKYPKVSEYWTLNLDDAEQFESRVAVEHFVRASPIFERKVGSTGTYISDGINECVDLNILSLDKPYSLMILKIDIAPVFIEHTTAKWFISND